MREDARRVRRATHVHADLNDAHGLISTLYQDIAEELLRGEATEGVFYNTDVERANLGKPLGEWP